MSDNFNNCYRPLTSEEEWKSLLVKPASQWKDGKSAKELARYWSSRECLPPEFQHLFGNEQIEILFIFPEYGISMPAQGGKSMNDIYILAATETGYSVIMVEAKAGEPFDSLISDWYQAKSKNTDQGCNAFTRLNTILSELGLEKYAGEPYTAIGGYRYQLFHRTLGAIIEAKRVRANRAFVIIQSFADDPMSLAEFMGFIGLLIPNHS